MNPAPLTLRLTLDSDWGAATGTGIAGGLDDVIEKEPGDSGLPLLRATILTGILREQAANAARALDGPDRHAWQSLAQTLFGTSEHPRLISLSDAPITVSTREGGDHRPTHTVIGVSIDEATGTAKEDFLRLVERAGKGSGEATITFLTEGLDRSPITWDSQQREDARLLLALAAQLITAVGSDRTSGDGACRALIVDDGTPLDRDWCASHVKRLLDDGVARDPQAPSPTRGQPVVLSAARQAGPSACETTATATLTIRLDTPLVSYEVPYSNEVRSLDFLRGTVLLPWVHSRLRHAFPSSDLVRDAVVTGMLRVSDATPVVGGVRGLPVPLVLSRDKRSGDSAAQLELWNRLHSQEPTGVHVPMRSGYIFDRIEGDAEVALGAPALVGRQSTAIQASTGAAATGQLFMVRALPAGVVLQAEVSLSAALHEIVDDQLSALLSRPARLGSRRLSGTYGTATCSLGPVLEATAPAPSGSAPEDFTIWCLSDVILRSPRLGTAGGVGPLLDALGGGLPLTLVPDPDAEGTDPRYAVGLRHRRVDGWSAASQQPRASRIAIQAGTTLRIAAQDAARNEELAQRLSRLQRQGIGHLREQGYGRIAVGHHLLADDGAGARIRARRLRQCDFTGEGSRS
ncbi:hypothetical protein ACSL103130_08655 [Actinomyces slackii]|uniref:Uncharacterized protein n=1 Tax=Actinomyces slackii TaxID=52774 RepID=A0A448KBR5_9ACTO|nr:hypothetical protein [Actinomyces slackii]VEG74356.1 Uncharacterised protein [Actinomyces slackii]